MYYQLLEGYTVTTDGEGAITYGVVVFDIADNTKNLDIPYEDTNCIYKNDDITFCREEMCHHIKLWNELQPSLPQLKDLIEDIICADVPLFPVK